MAFSFTPGQITPQGSQATAPQGTIPGASLSPAVGPPSDSPFLFIRERGQPLSIMACVQIVLTALAVLSVLTCVILYSYSLYLNVSIKDKKTQLEASEALIKKYPFTEMLNLSLRTTALNDLLKAYISPRSPLKFLEDVVENQVVFNDFALTLTPAGYIINFTVITSNYKSLIQQLEALNLKEYSKVAPKLKSDGLVDGVAQIKIKVTTPVVVQGILPNELVFLNQDVTTAVTSSATSTGSSTPQ